MSDLQSYEDLRAILDELRTSASAEERTAFDPSGSSSSRQEDDHVSEASTDLGCPWNEEVASSSGATGDTDLTSNSRSLERVHLDNIIHDQATEALSDQEKVARLQEMFPEIKTFDIEWTLRKARYSFGKAVEELLNQAFLEGGMDSGASLVKRGIDGFSESNPRVRRKKKGKKTSVMTDPRVELTSIDAKHPRSEWDRMKEDIDFLEQRTFISRETISSKYHGSGANLPSTITALCASEEPDANPYITGDTSTILEMHTIDMAPEFPTLPYAQISALIRLSHPSTTSARELARALLSSPPPDPTALKILPQYLPRPRSPDEVVTSRPSSPSLHLDPSTAAALANSRAVAFTQAQSAFRKSKSNPHFGGAASYYSQIGRDASAALRKHEAAAADQLVASQSQPGEIDLHGVNARDAVRISKAKVDDWWDREAREWSGTGKSKGEFRIVTGRGQHSTGGKGVLGPAVFKALVVEGWNVRMERGYIVISGHMKK